MSRRKGVHASTKPIPHSITLPFYSSHLWNLIFALFTPPHFVASEMDTGKNANQSKDYDEGQTEENRARVVVWQLQNDNFIDDDDDDGVTSKGIRG